MIRVQWVRKCCVCFLCKVFCWRMTIVSLIMIACFGQHVRAAVVFWEDEFIGTPQVPSTTWEVEFDQYSNTTYTALVYSQQSSYAYVSILARPGRAGAGYIKSPRLQCDIDTFGALEMRVSDISGQTFTAWSLALEVDIGLENPKLVALQPGTNGATGNFTYALHELSDVSGMTTFQIRMDTQLNIDVVSQGYILLDYIRLYETPKYRDQDYLQKGSQKSYVDFWQEDFSNGEVHQSVNKWWDYHDDVQGKNELSAEINYTESGARVSMLSNTSSALNLFVVRAPGIFWDPVAYPLVRTKLLGLSQNTRCVVKAIEIGRSDGGEWRRLELGSVDQSGEWVFDIRSVANWYWREKRMLALEFFIEGPAGAVYSPGIYYDLAYVAISKEQLPTPVSEDVPTYATPNPFYPLRGQSAEIHFDLSGLTQNYVIRIVNLKGQVVRELDNKNIWDGKDDTGRLCEGGVYIYQLKTNQKRMSGQIVLLK